MLGWTWEALVGSGWPAYVRILHPAFNLGSAGELQAVRWRDVAAVDSDLRTANWSGISGARLHSGTTGAMWSIEPEVGPGDPSITPNVLGRLIEGAGPVMLGQWTGYGNRERPSGARVISRLGGARTYYVVPIDPLRGHLTPLAEQLLARPDIAWDEAGSFLGVSDIDLPCTIVGCTSAIAQRLLASPDLEAVLVEPSAPIVA